MYGPLSVPRIPILFPPQGLCWAVPSAWNALLIIRSQQNVTGLPCPPRHREPFPACLHSLSSTQLDGPASLFVCRPVPDLSPLESKDMDQLMAAAPAPGKSQMLREECIQCMVRFLPVGFKGWRIPYNYRQKCGHHKSISHCVHQILYGVGTPQRLRSTT